MGKFGSNEKVSNGFWPLNVSYKELFQVVNGNLMKNTWSDISLQIQRLKGKTILCRMPSPGPFRNRFGCILPRVGGAGPRLAAGLADPCGPDARMQAPDVGPRALGGGVPDAPETKGTAGRLSHGSVRSDSCAWLRAGPEGFPSFSQRTACR